MRTLIARNITYPALQFLRDERIYTHLKELTDSQWLDNDELKKRQWRDLQSLLHTAYKKNDFYRKRFIKAGIAPDEINSYEDFLKLPILEKEDLRSSVKNMISSIDNKTLELRRTSGSTGIPLQILKSRNSFGRIRALYHRYYQWYGINIADRQARFMGHPVSFKSKECRLLSTQRGYQRPYIASSTKSSRI